MPRPARAVQPPAPLPLRSSASAWRSSRSRAGSDRGWQSPCGRTRRRDPRQAFARRCSRFRRTPASRSPQEAAGCLCCLRSIPGRRPAADHPPAPVASASGRTRPDAARPRSGEAPTQGSVPAAAGRARPRTRWSWADPSAPCRQSRGPGSSDRARRSWSSCRPRNRRDFGRCWHWQCVPRPGAGSR